MSAFAEKLKRFREAAGLTQPELAEKAGMNRFGIAKLEQAEREPSWATVQKLASALGVTCQEFADENAVEADAPASKKLKPPKAEPSKLPEVLSGLRSTPPKAKPTRVGEAFKKAKK